MKNLMLITVTLALAWGRTAAQTNNRIIVEVENIKSAEGTLNVGVFNSEKTFLEEPWLSQRKAAEANTRMVFEFTGVPDGAYTVSVYHDINGNGELDTNFIGIPVEPYGVSREGRNMFGPPSYADAVFTLDGDNVRLRITLE